MTPTVPSVHTTNQPSESNQTDSFSSLHLLPPSVFALITERTCPPSTTNENKSLTRTSGANSTSKSNKPSGYRRPFVRGEKRRRATWGRKPKGFWEVAEV
ncbi:hypothetical protein CesoFtcFv8_017935 [Champsocephalus esox]|uniref:Uncharacterized protein n=1 Tax=Champsocephalus esox TaxID=159716 RepID=A0AAN8GPM0_9TELE|nr:hypothetical protein CesoFtcFv8_017935 [Champsocephalus esox]